MNINDLGAMPHMGFSSASDMVKALSLSRDVNTEQTRVLGRIAERHTAQAYGGTCPECGNTWPCWTHLLAIGGDL